MSAGLGGPTRREVKVMSEGEAGPLEASLAAGDPRPAGARTDALRERLFVNALGVA